MRGAKWEIRSRIGRGRKGPNDEMTIADSHDVSRILAGIDFLSACGQPVDEPWAISRPKNMREAILDHATSFGAFLLVRDREMCRMVPEWSDDPERHFMEAFGNISGPIEQLVKSCIWPRSNPTKKSAILSSSEKRPYLIV